MNWDLTIFQTPKHPTFKRMVAWLKENRPDIPLTGWNGKQPEDLDAKDVRRKKIEKEMDEYWGGMP